MLLKNALLHFKKILTHKYWVAYYCFKCGLYWQGITHDLSKFSPTEFFESIKYYQGTRSPIDACKEDKGYSNAWFHHRGRNKHHWEYWVDDFEKGVIPKKMPFKYVLEMFCDFLGASRAYNNGILDVEKVYEWWKDKRKRVIMHEATKDMMDSWIAVLNVKGSPDTQFRHIAEYKEWYKKSQCIANNGIINE